MDINRNNYEAYFLDFAEGNLSSAEEELLHRFLKFNPDLAEELKSFSLLSITPPDLEYPEKESLKKEFPEDDSIITKNNFDFFCIAYLEGDLTEIQQNSLDEFLKKEVYYQRLFEIYQATFVKKEEIRYPEKNKLFRKKSRIFDISIFVPLAAAAAMALFFIIGPYLKTNPVQVASIENPEKKTEKIPEITSEKPTGTKSTPAALNVIRTKSAPVPKSDYKSEQQIRKMNPANKEDEKNVSEQKIRVASLDLQQQPISVNSSRYDQIHPEAIKPPTVNPGSLSLIGLARYQFHRASDVIEEDDVLLWNLASSGLKELNKITGSDVHLLASRNNEGAISGIQFRSKYLNLTTPINRDE